MLHTNIRTAIAEERLSTIPAATDALARSAQRCPGAPAVVDLTSGARLDYAALDALADRAAGWIAARLNGAADGERVAYLGRNGIELLAIALGAERCGAIFVPLNWRLAAPEIAALIEDCTPALIVAQDEFVPLLGGRARVSGALAEIETAIPAARRELSEERTILLLYTSGTTGRPKGSIVTQANADAGARNFAAVAEVNENSVMFSALPMFHTIGLIAVARATLMAGGTVVLTDRFVAPQALAALGDPSLGITHYFAVPVMAEALLREPGFDEAALSRLKAIFAGGAPVAPALIARFAEIGVPLVNGYGMSEAGTVIHMPIDRELIAGSEGAVGRPAPEIAVRLVEDGHDVRDGDTGEVWLKGLSVTPGYWNRPDESADVFTDGWYRTGDLARRDAGGLYHIVDRLKDMYVSGGENVYPAEVEAVLLEHPGVVDAAVIGMPDARWGESGVAVVVPSGELDVDVLRAHCLERLARYKCPAQFVAVDAIPRSAAGKILKPALRQRLISGDLK